MPRQAGLTCAVLVPRGKVAIGKMAQTLVHGARVLEVEGNFDDSLELAKDLAERFPVTLVNSVNPYRLQGQKTCAFEIVDALGRAPDLHCVPVGNAGNISSHWIGYSEYLADGVIAEPPQLMGFQAQGAAPIVRGEPVKDPQTIATAIRIGNPASWGHGRRGSHRVRRCDRRGDRPGDPRRLSTGGARGTLRRARERCERRRTAASPRRGPAPTGCHGRLHLDRPRTEGSGVGDLRGGAAGRGRARCRRRRVGAGALADVRVTVRVPATSANLGPGFDCFGLALELCNEVTLDTDGEPGVEWRGEGEGELPSDGTDLISRTIAHVASLGDLRPPPMRLIGRNLIPLERGLGSSSAAAVAGAVLGSILLDPALDLRGGAGAEALSVFALAAEVEGHPDNAAPATFGGFTIAVPDGPVRRLDPHPDLRPVALVPAKLRLATGAARAALPGVVSRDDAIFNAAHAALMVHAMTQEPSLLVAAMQDRLHQDLRLSLVPEVKEVFEAVRAEGFAVCVSGSGPALLAFETERRLLPELGDDWVVLRVSARSAGFEVTGS